MVIAATVPIKRFAERTTGRPGIAARRTRKPTGSKNSRRKNGLRSHDPVPRGLPPPLADAEDRLRAVTTFDRNVVVTAGAGTGKTALLTERLLNLFFRREHPATPAECAALTFTNRAAGEMAERLRRYLERFIEWSAQGGPPPGSGDLPAKIYLDIAARYGWNPEALGDVARRTLRDIEMAPISTYHSFAGRLLRLHPLEAGVDPSFREDDGTVFDERFRRGWEKWLARELRLGASREALWRRTLSEFDLSALEGLAKELCSELISLADLEGALGDGTLFQAPAGWLEEKIAAAKELTGRFEKDRKIENWTRKAVDVLEAFHRGVPEGEIEDLAAPIQGDMPGKVQGLSEEDHHACKRFIGLARGLASLNRKALSDALEAVLPFARKFREKFVRSGHLTFDSILVRTRDLLRDHPRIRRALKDRFRHLLVDEFQDTDPVQYEIVLYLAEERGTEARSWRDVRLEPGKLFIVGDPKQSIYSFRRADIAAYQALLKEMVKEGPLALRVNFRSHDRIVGAVNAMFDRVIRPREGVQPPYLPAAPRPGGPAGLASQKVEVRVVRPEGDETWNADEANEQEARALARWIEEDLVGRVEIPDEKDGVRLVEYGDVSLLLRKTANAGIYVDALRERGVPHVVEAGRGFFETQEVTDFLNLLASLAYPEDRLSLAGVLRSPIGGLTDRELYAWARGEDLPNASALLEKLREVRGAIRRLPVSDALDRILLAFPVLESAALLAEEQGRSNVLKVRSLALRREEGLEGGFARLVDWLREQGKEVRDEGESPLAEENVNAVRLLTVHKAKGLEFPIVVLAGLQAGSRVPRDRVRVGRDRSTGTWALRVDPAQTPGMLWAEDRAAALRDSEERRLFYVAATRARERLVFSTAVRRGGKGGGEFAVAEGFLAYLNEALGTDVRDEDAKWPSGGGGGGGDGNVERVVVAPPAEGEAPGRPGRPGREKEEAPIPQNLEQTWTHRRAEAERVRKRLLDIRPSHLNEEEGEAGWAKSEGEGIPRDRRRLVGSVAHGVLERIDLKAPDRGLDDAVRLALDDCLPEAPKDERKEIYEEVKEMVSGFVGSSDFTDRIRPFEVLGREVPCFLPDVEKNGFVGSVEGKVDLVIRDAEGILVIDYKTDKIDSEKAGERAEKYRRQGELYGRALSDALGVEVKRFGVAFLRPAVLETLDLDGV